MLFEIVLLYIVYPLCILMGIRKKTMFNSYAFITPKDSDILKGIAAWMVIFAHYTTYLTQEGIQLGVLIPFKRLGPLGVGIFFFVSGYGLYMSNNKTLKLDFLKKRIVNVYLPFVVFQLLSYYVLNKSYKGIDFVLYLLGIIEPKWFVTIIMIFYFIYWLTWNSKIKKKIEFIFVFSIIMSSVLYCMGMGEYWYATNVLFPFGLLFAKYQDEILQKLNKSWVLNLLFFTISFVASIIFYVCVNHEICVLGKTFASVFLVMIVVMLLMIFDINSFIMQWFGKMSLYLYMVHSSIWIFIKKHFIISCPKTTLIFICLTIFLAYIMFKVMNVQKLIKRNLKG